MKIAVLQMTSGTDRAENTTALVSAIGDAAAHGADMLFAPEMSGLIDRNRARAAHSITAAADATQIAALCAAVRHAGIWAHIGSLPCHSDATVETAGKAAGKAVGKFANRSLVIAPDGSIAAQYDKIHLFDVALPSGETWRESNAYNGGGTPVAVHTPWGLLGLSICYDVRFSALYMAYAALGANLIAIPAAFTQSTGAAHWHVLVRARAIEAQAFVIAAAQTGAHADGRQTYGHSLVVDPWGDVLLDMGSAPGLDYATLDLDRIAAVRAAIPVQANARPIGPVTVA